MRTHTQFLEDASRVDSAVLAGESDALAIECGIKGVPILSHLSSLFFPQSFPFDFMHLMYENLIKNLIDFFSGSFKDLEHEGQGYRVDKKVWTAIGEATEASGSTIPGAYGARPRDFSEKRTGITADMLSFWTIYLGPIYLEKSFAKQEFYDHFVRLVKLINLCLQFEITRVELEEIREGFAQWVEDYERLYYQYSEDRLSACPLTVHCLLHIADGIDYMGPSWVYWAFGTERFCGKLGRLVKSRRFPFSNLKNQVLMRAQLMCIKLRYESVDVPVDPSEDTDAGEQRVWETPITNRPDCEYSLYRLLPPQSEKPVDLDSIESMKRRIAVHLVTRFASAAGDITLSLAQAVQLLEAATVKMWGRLKRLEGGDTMLASEVVKTNMEDRRDATFVRYELWVDKLAHHKNVDPDYQLESFFGQLRYIFQIHFPKDLPFLPSDLAEVIPRTLALGAIRPIHNPRPHPDGLDIHYYKQLGTVDEVVDVTAIQCLVARAQWAGKWALFDRSGGLARAEAVFQD